MKYVIDESKIIEVAKNKLPDISSVSTKITVVYVNDFEGSPQFVDRLIQIEIPNGEQIYIDKQKEFHIYYVVFQKIFVDGDFEWDLIGYSTTRRL